MTSLGGERRAAATQTGGRAGETLATPSALSEDPAPDGLAGALSDRLGRAAAERSLERRRWRVRRRVEGAAAGLAGLELVGLPVVVASAPGPRLYVVDRVLGNAWVLDLGALTERAEASSCRAARDGDHSAARGRAPERAAPAFGVPSRESGVGGQLACPLPPRLSIASCVPLLEAIAARRALTLGRGRRAALPELGAPREATYPFWLGYRVGRRGRIHFAVLDAVTGARPGSALRAAIAAALVGAEADGSTCRLPASPPGD